MPAITPAVDVKGKLVPFGVSKLVVNEIVGAVTDSQVDSSETSSISWRYAIAPSGDAHGAGMQSVSDPSLIG